MRTRQMLLGLLMVGCTPSGFQVEDEDAGVVSSEAGIEGGDSGVDAGSDADVGPVSCFVDRDGDGVGGGEPVACDLVLDSGVEQGLDGGGAHDGGSGDGGADGGEHADEGDAPSVVPTIVTEGGDCDDHDARRAPGLQEVCDGLDNDCGDDVDEQINNACGGPCLAPLEHEPGELCSNGLLGACERDGKFVCATAQSVQCDAPAQQPSSELCGDELDNDCDGATDEPDAVDAVTWFQDCDEDGYAASTASGVKGCTKPANVGDCGWTSVYPQQATRTNWDCDDSRLEYSPTADFGQPPNGATSWDLNCDGQLSRASSVDVVACPASVVELFNNGVKECDPHHYVGMYCYLWKDSSGRYVSVPSATTGACPDVAYTLNPDAIDDPWNMTTKCAVGTNTSARWQCR